MAWSRSESLGCWVYWSCEGFGLKFEGLGFRVCVQVDCLKGVPVDMQLKEATPDPYFAQHVRDMYSSFFGKAKGQAS